MQLRNTIFFFFFFILQESLQNTREANVVQKTRQGEVYWRVQDSFLALCSPRVLLRNNWSINQANTVIQTSAVCNRSTWFEIRQQKDGLSKDTDKEVLSWCQVILCFFFFSFWHAETRWVVLVNMIFFFFLSSFLSSSCYRKDIFWLVCMVAVQTWRVLKRWRNNNNNKRVATFNAKDLTAFRKNKR